MVEYKYNPLMTALKSGLFKGVKIVLKPHTFLPWWAFWPSFNFSQIWEVKGHIKDEAVRIKNESSEQGFPRRSTHYEWKPDAAFSMVRSKPFRKVFSIFLFHVSWCRRASSLIYGAPGWNTAWIKKYLQTLSSNSFNIFHGFNHNK